MCKICVFFADQICKEADRVFTLMGAVLFIIIGVECIDFFKDILSSTASFVGLIKGCTAIVNGLLMLADMVLITWVLSGE